MEINNAFTIYVLEKELELIEVKKAKEINRFARENCENGVLSENAKKELYNFVIPTVFKHSQEVSVELNEPFDEMISMFFEIATDVINNYNADKARDFTGILAQKIYKIKEDLIDENPILLLNETEKDLKTYNSTYYKEYERFEEQDFDPLFVYIETENLEEIYDRIEKESEKRRKYMYHQYGLRGYEELTITQIAKKYNVSKKGVSAANIQTREKLSRLKR